MCHENLKDMHNWRAITPKQNARRKSRAFYQSVQEVFLLIINSLDNRENFPLSIRLRKRYVINPVWSDEFSGSNVSRNIQHTYLFRPLRLGKVWGTLGAYILHDLRSSFLPHRNV